MSETEGFLMIDSQNAAKIGDKADKTAIRCPQNVARPKLADISNMPPKQRPIIQHEKSQSIPITIKEYIAQLQKENMALAKMLAQKNKLVEQSGIELDRLRLNFIKMQEQNQQLALSHTQMLMELNSGKDRLKALQHELGCKVGLLKARELKHQEEKASMRPLQHEFVEEGREFSKDGRDDEKPCNTKRRLRTQSLGASEPLQSEHNTGKRRTSFRRQSAKFKATESKNAEDLFGINDTGFQECPLPNEESIPEKASMKPCQHEDAVVLNKFQKKEESSKDGKDDEKPCNAKKRLRSHSLGSSELLQPEDNAGKRRTILRRQSTRFKAVESKDAQDLIGINDIGFQECPLRDDESVPEKASIKPCQNEDSGVLSKSQEEGESLTHGRGDGKPFNTRKRLQSHSLSSSEPLQSEDNAGNKRPVVRRKSSRFKAVESKDDTDLKSQFPTVLENESKSVNTSSAGKEDEKSSRDIICESQRPSLCRPSRVAATKVQSYKEIPLNVKMRRHH